MTGNVPSTSVYTIRVKTTQKGIRAFKLEALPHKSLPRNGPGRTGNFVLNEFVVSEGADQLKPPDQSGPESQT